MSNIIKEIEAEQLKATVDQFEVGVKSRSTGVPCW